MSRLHVRVSTTALLFISFAVAAHAQGDLFSFTDVSKSLKDIATGVSKDISSYIPTPETIFESSKNLLVGYPFEAASTAINTICKYWK